MQQTYFFCGYLCLFLLQSGKSSYQSATAEKDHEDDERLKPAVLHNLVAGLPQPPPGLTEAAAGVDVAALAVSRANWQGGAKKTQTREEASGGE